MNNNKVYIEFLNSLNKNGWFSLFDKIFIQNSYPKPMPFKMDYPDELLIQLYKLILESDNYSLLNTYQSFLFEYYYSIPIFKKYYERIYLLHRVFARLKNHNVKYQKLFNQFFENSLFDKYYNNLNLQTSLLSLLIELPNIEDYDLSTHLFNTINRTTDYSYYYVSLKYFIKHKTIIEYFNYFSTLIACLKNFDETLINMLTESIIDLRDFYGGFQKLYEHIDSWEKIKEKNPRLISEITRTITKKYLQKGKKWFDNDIFAELFKIYINSFKYPPSLKILENIFKKLVEKNYSFNKIEYYISMPFTLKKFWKNYIFSFQFFKNSYSRIKISTSIIFLKNILENNVELDYNILNFYNEQYNIKREELLIIDPDEDFMDIIYKYYREVDSIYGLLGSIPNSDLQKNKYEGSVPSRLQEAIKNLKSEKEKKYAVTV